MTINDDNFFIIKGWMRTELDLKGNELLVYALIYNFQQNTGKPCNASQSFIAEWIGTDRRSVIRVTESLEKKGLIKTIQSKKGCIKSNVYECQNVTYENKLTSDKMSLARVTNCHTESDFTSDKMSLARVTNCHTTSDKMSLVTSDKLSHNNKEYNKEENKEEKREAKKTRSNSFSEFNSISFQKPTRKQLEKYCKQKNLNFDIDCFIDYYEANGWMVGNAPMRSWRAIARNWSRREKKYETKTNQAEKGETNADEFSEYKPKNVTIIHTKQWR